MKTYQVQRDKEGHLVVLGLVTSKALTQIKAKLKTMGYSDYKKLPIRKVIEVNINKEAI